MNYETFWDFAKTSIFNFPIVITLVAMLPMTFLVFVVFAFINQPEEYSSIKEMLIGAIKYIVLVFSMMFILLYIVFHDQFYARYLESNHFVRNIEGVVTRYTISEGRKPSLSFDLDGRNFVFNFNEYISPSFYLVKDTPITNGSRVRLTYVEPSLDPTWWWIGGRQWVTRFEIAREKTPR